MELPGDNHEAQQEMKAKVGDVQSYLHIKHIERQITTEAHKHTLTEAHKHMQTLIPSAFRDIHLSSDGWSRTAILFEQCWTGEIKVGGRGFKKK